MPSIRCVQPLLSRGRRDRLRDEDPPERKTTDGYAGEKPFSEATAEAVDAEVRKIIGEGHAELLVRETLSEQEILEVTGLPPAPALETGILPVTGAGGTPSS